MVFSGCVSIDISDEMNGVVQIRAIRRPKSEPIDAVPVCTNNPLVADVVSCVVERGAITLPPARRYRAYLDADDHVSRLFLVSS